MEILRARYLRRNDRGAVIENVDGMFARVAHAIAAPARLFGEDREYWRARFRERLRRLEIFSNSPP